MKKLVYTLLATTTLTSAVICAAYAQDPVEMDHYSMVATPSFGKTVDPSYIQESEVLQSVVDQKIAQAVTDFETEAAKVAPTFVSFTTEEADRAVDFADLAYKAYNNDQKYRDLKANYEAQGYTIAPIHGETGHLSWTNLFVKKTTIGLALTKGDEAVLAFRGTKNASDTITDLGVYNVGKAVTNVVKNVANKVAGLFGLPTVSATSEESDENGVHSGFKATFDSYKPQLTQIFDQLKTDNVKKTTIVGHSLGGALAQLTASDLADKAKKTDSDMQMKVATFNAPRVGNSRFAAKLDESLGGSQNNARFTNGSREAVASAVPGSIDFKHAGRNVIVDESPDRGLLGNLWDKTKNVFYNHKLEGFKDGKAGRAVENLNNAPYVHKGVKQQLSELKDQAVAVVKEQIKALPAKVQEVKKNVAAAIQDAGAAAKSTFVNGFQKARGAVAGWFGW
jgi:hypothetical protein